ncbi:MAG: M6 family metalloprotease domain-containing protein [Bacteroidaceae bacterium]|nr:M6 family metalloprotease domain-containing protein [Bacteroidaceae bacterium]
MKRFVYTMLCLLLVGVVAYGKPAKRGFRSVKTSDGKELRVQLVGDECFHQYVTEDGRTVQQNEDGTFDYTLVQRPAEPARSKARRQQNDLRRKQRAAQATNDFVGKKNGLVILMSYSDKAMKHTNQEFDDMFNLANYSKNNHIGSLSDYFYDQSYGQLDVTFDVVGPYTTANKLSYYGSNDSDGNDKYPGDLVEEAVTAAHNDGVNFSKYDWNNDGYVDQIYIIYAGYAESYGAAANTIWPHEWNLTSTKYYNMGGHGPMTYDGVVIDTYACSSELTGTSGTTMDGIGSAAHEFSHCLGLPDAYDTEGENPGMGVWSLMDYGCYNGNGNVPSPYTAYERMYSGWLEPVVLSEPTKVTDMKPITEGPYAYIIYNEANKNEYYILENHQYEHNSTQFAPWDYFSYGHGMLVMHIDYDKKAWEDNTVNTVASRQRMTYVPANNVKKNIQYISESEMAGATWPGTSKKTSLTNTTTPAAALYNANSDGKKYLNKPIENIAETDGVISFTFDGGSSIPAPEVPEKPEVIDSTSFIASWSPVEGAQTYTLEVTEKDTTQQTLVFFEEDFSGFKATSDGSTDISEMLDDYMQMEDWMGIKVYESDHQAKIGTSKAVGALLSPVFEAPADGTLQVTVGVKQYKTDTGKLQVYVLNEDGDVLDEDEVTPDGQLHDFEFSGIDENFYVVFTTSSKRAYITYAYAATGGGGMAKKPGVPVVYTGITETQYTLTDLNPGSIYNYRVKAVTKEGESQWSKLAEVKLEGGTTDIASLRKEYDAKHETYTIDGLRVTNITRPGLYIRDGKKFLKK